MAKAMAMGGVLAGLLALGGEVSANNVQTDSFGNSLAWMKTGSQNGNIVKINRDTANRLQYKPSSGGNNATPIPIPRPR
jgi:hypothetical protein